MRFYLWFCIFIVSLFTYAQLSGLYIPHIVSGKSGWAKSGPSTRLNHK